ncbi:MAG: TerC family protein [Alphaproteobacteria bacterium]|nr:TerC family protein [Alphaproteobacteria bacterium]HRI76789.1 TerC family protein [Alphaproteobacteria bacterium]
MDKPLWMWAVFFGVVLFLLFLDLGVFQKKSHEIGMRESLKMSAFYISVGLLYGAWLWFELGAAQGSLYLTGFLVEKSLSLDNIFVISLVFAYFKIPRMYQHRVLFWGILGVIVLRGSTILMGATIIHKFEWVLYLFAAFLIFSGIKMLFMKHDDEDEDIGKNPVLKFFKKHMRVTNELHGDKFWVRQADEKTGKLAVFATPLFLALLVIEFVDLIFAVDSIPAIFALTTDPYIVFTSNVFAILGLRALYFALAVILVRFKYLKYALALVLVFIGSKVFVADLLDLDKIPAVVSLGVTLSLLAGGMLYSLYKTKQEERAGAA